MPILKVLGFRCCKDVTSSKVTTCMPLRCKGQERELYVHEIGPLSHVSCQLYCKTPENRTSLPPAMHPYGRPPPPPIGPHVHKCDIRHAQHVAAFTYVSCPVIFPLTSVQEHKEDFNDIIHCNGSSSVQLLGSVLESPPSSFPFHIYFIRGSGQEESAQYFVCDMSSHNKLSIPKILHGSLSSEFMGQFFGKMPSPVPVMRLNFGM